MIPRAILDELHAAVGVALEANRLRSSSPQSLSIGMSEPRFIALAVGDWYFVTHPKNWRRLKDEGPPPDGIVPHVWEPARSSDHSICNDSMQFPSGHDELLYGFYLECGDRNYPDWVAMEMRDFWPVPVSLARWGEPPRDLCQDWKSQLASLDRVPSSTLYVAAPDGLLHWLAPPNWLAISNQNTTDYFLDSSSSPPYCPSVARWPPGVCSAGYAPKGPQVAASGLSATGLGASGLGASGITPSQMRDRGFDDTAQGLLTDYRNASKLKRGKSKSNKGSRTRWQLFAAGVIAVIGVLFVTISWSDLSSRNTPTGPTAESSSINSHPKSIAPKMSAPVEFAERPPAAVPEISPDELVLQESFLLDSPPSIAHEVSKPTIDLEARLAMPLGSLSDIPQPVAQQISPAVDADGALISKGEMPEPAMPAVVDETVASSGMDMTENETVAESRTEAIEASFLVGVSKRITMENSVKRVTVTTRESLHYKKGVCAASLEFEPTAGERFLVAPSNSQSLEGAGTCSWVVSTPGMTPELVVVLKSTPSRRWELEVRIGIRDTPDGRMRRLGDDEAAQRVKQLQVASQWNSTAQDQNQAVRDGLLPRGPIAPSEERRILQRQARELEDSLEQWLAIQRMQSFIQEHVAIEATLSAAPLAP